MVFYMLWRISLKFLISWCYVEVSPISGYDLSNNNLFLNQIKVKVEIEIEITIPFELFKEAQP